MMRRVLASCCVCFLVGWTDSNRSGMVAAQDCDAEGRCDTHERCRVWALEEGECLRERIFMTKTCPVSCAQIIQQAARDKRELPKGECKDLHEHWCVIGNCEKRLNRAAVDVALALCVCACVFSCCDNIISQSLSCIFCETVKTRRIRAKELTFHLALAPFSRLCFAFIMLRTARTGPTWENAKKMQRWLNSVQNRAKPARATTRTTTMGARTTMRTVECGLKQANATRILVCYFHFVAIFC
jgi:hypothetical protein